MRKLILALALAASPAFALDHAPFNGPTPYAADQLDADKNECMLHALPKPPAFQRHPELSSVKPQTWDNDWLECDGIFDQWKAKINNARASRHEPPL